MALNVRKENVVEHYPVASATLIAIGDNLFYDGTANEVKPLSDFTWNTNLATTQGDLKGSYAGVALSRSQAAETADIRVAMRGTATFDCASASFNPDEFVGADDNATPDGLENQKVIGVANAGLSIGKPVNVVASVTKVDVRFNSDIAGQPTA